MMEGDLASTPGYFYAIAYWISCILFVSTNRKRFKGAKFWIIQVIFPLVLVTFMELTDGIDAVFFIPCMLTSICFMLIYIYLSCDFTIYNAGYYLARAFITGELMASLGWQLYYYAYLRFNITGIKAELPFMLFIDICIAGGFFVWEYRHKGESSDIQITRRELVYVVIISLAVFLVSNLSYVYKNSPFSSQFTLELFIIRTLVDLGGMAILFAYHLQLKDLKMKLEVDTLQNIIHMQYESYRLSMESMELVNQKYHDLKHHIALLRAEAVSDKRIEYLDKMEREIKIYEAQNKTGNKVLDAVLTNKSLYCQKNSIGLTCVADGSLLSFMEDIDITVLFGNALDNAIESVKKLSDTEKRLIHLSVSREKGFVRIRVENYCEDKILFDEGLPVTTKSDKRYHGYGIKSIKNTAKKYGGSVTIDCRNNWFELRILFPRP